MRRQGFTLVELMIVIAIIAVIAAIATPSLLRNKLEANQTSAVVSLRAIAAGQTLWHKNDYDHNDVADYVADYSQLYYAEVNAETVKIIDKALADARGTGGAAKSGYLFGDLATGANGTAYEVQYEFGHNAWPAVYNRSGLQVFVIDTTGAVYQRDLGSDGSVYFADYPDTAAWMAVQ